MLSMTSAASKSLSLRPGSVVHKTPSSDDVLRGRTLLKLTASRVRASSERRDHEAHHQPPIGMLEPTSQSLVSRWSDSEDSDCDDHDDDVVASEGSGDDDQLGTQTASMGDLQPWTSTLLTQNSRIETLPASDHSDKPHWQRPGSARNRPLQFKSVPMEHELSTTTTTSSSATALREELLDDRGQPIHTVLVAHRHRLNRSLPVLLADPADYFLAKKQQSLDDPTGSDSEAEKLSVAGLPLESPLSGSTAYSSTTSVAALPSLSPMTPCPSMVLSRSELSPRHLDHHSAGRDATLVSRAHFPGAVSAQQMHPNKSAESVVKSPRLGHEFTPPLGYGPLLDNGPARKTKANAHLRSSLVAMTASLRGTTAKDGRLMSPSSRSPSSPRSARSPTAADKFSNAVQNLAIKANPARWRKKTPHTSNGSASTDTDARGLTVSRPRTESPKSLDFQLAAQVAQAVVTPSATPPPILNTFNGTVSDYHSHIAHSTPANLSPPMSSFVPERRSPPAPSAHANGGHHLRRPRLLPTQRYDPSTVRRLRLVASSQELREEQGQHWL
ncbi:unnamed protein product [Parajaminaea phylloscopi]